MKKTIAILLILVIGMVGVFAAVNTATDTLKLETTVPAQYGLVIANAKAAEIEANDDDEIEGVTLLESFLLLQSIESVSFMDSDNNSYDSGPLYVNYMTNERIQATVTTKMYPLLPPEDSSITTKIGYSVYVGTNEIETIVSQEDATAGKDITFITESAVNNGIRVASEVFSITLNNEDWATASAAAYSTTWEVNLSIE